MISAVSSMKTSRKAPLVRLGCCRHLPAVHYRRCPPDPNCLHISALRPCIDETTPEPWHPGGARKKIRPTRKKPGNAPSSPPILCARPVLAARSSVRCPPAQDPSTPQDRHGRAKLLLSRPATPSARQEPRPPGTTPFASWRNGPYAPRVPRSSEAWACPPPPGNGGKWRVLRSEQARPNEFGRGPRAPAATPSARQEPRPPATPLAPPDQNVGAGPRARPPRGRRGAPSSRGLAAIDY